MRVLVKIGLGPPPGVVGAAGKQGGRLGTHGRIHEGKFRRFCWFHAVHLYLVLYVKFCLTVQWYKNIYILQIFTGPPFSVI